MSVVEEIQAAIEKLTKLRDETNYSEMNGWLAESVPGATGQIEDDPGYAPLTNDPLIVTLHRTIGAQLAILQHDVDMHAKFVHDRREDVWLDAVERAGDLALARAINGPSS